MNIIIKSIPNSITSLNLICGSAGIICAFEGRIDISFILMLSAAVCDFLDGFSARALKAYSPMGKELDSLADMISFGLLPSIMLYRLMFELGGSSFWNYIPMIIAVFSALRLAKFNIDERQTENFIGLATPASAMICGSLAYYILHEPYSYLTVWASGKVFIPLLSVVLSSLLVSEIPMFSMKSAKPVSKSSPLYKQRVTFLATILISVLLTIILGLNWSMIVLLIFTSYVILNLLSKPLFGR